MTSLAPANFDTGIVVISGMQWLTTDMYEMH